MPHLRRLTVVACATLLTASAVVGCGDNAKTGTTNPETTETTETTKTTKTTVSTPIDTRPSTVAPGDTMTQTPTERTDTGAPS